QAEREATVVAARGAGQAGAGVAGGDRQRHRGGVVPAGRVGGVGDREARLDRVLQRLGRGRVPIVVGRGQLDVVGHVGRDRVEAVGALDVVAARARDRVVERAVDRIRRISGDV